MPRRVASSLRRRNAALTLVAALHPLAGIAASITAAGPSGGPGGNPFSCGPAPSGGEAPRVAEIRIRSGRFVDSVQLVYSDGRVGPLRGGANGALQSVHLAPDEFISQIDGRFGTQVDALTIRTNKGKTLATGGMGGNATFSYTAPPGLAIVDFVGRSGLYLDAIGACYFSAR